MANKLFINEKLFKSTVYAISKSYHFQFPFYNSKFQSNHEAYCEFLCKKVHMTTSYCYGEKEENYQLIIKTKSFEVYIFFKFCFFF